MTKDGLVRLEVITCLALFNMFALSHCVVCLFAQWGYYKFYMPCGGYAVFSGVVGQKVEVNTFDANGNPYMNTEHPPTFAIGRVHGNHTVNSTVTEQVPSNRTLHPTVIGVPVNQTLNTSTTVQVPRNRTLNATVSLQLFLIDLVACPSNVYRRPFTDNLMCEEASKWQRRLSHVAFITTNFM